MKKLILLIIALIVSLNNSIAWADCVDISSASSWSRVDSHKILIYRGSTAIALLVIPYCYISSGSEISFIEDIVCDGGIINIDGEECDIRNVEKL